MADADSAGSPRGVKRKADALDFPGRIKPLDEDVVNKIAAGEIIVAPVHALKELIENAVDAGSTNLEILVKDGGLKLLQITDNGCGIHRDDLSILCERFTTSKLKSFEDLMQIGTYGFRGEALASISHIAHLTVTTKTANSSCAWKAQYAGGKLTAPKPGQSADPKPCAGRQGTQIQVEDLFYNVPTRRRAFRSAGEEYAKIAEQVGKYAVHCSGVAFSCKKAGESGVGITVPANASTKDRIRIVHNSAIANDLVAIETANEQYGFKATGFTSSVNYNGKKTTMLLFINHRSVDSSAIKKAVEQTYARFLPKGGKPFVYISLEIDPARVDVNVHPTKREVNFLDEDEIIQLICEEIAAKLGTVDTSRSFVTQSLMTGTTTPILTRSNTIAGSDTDQTSQRHRVSSASTGAKKVYENNLVRTDARSQKITSMFRTEQSGASLQESLGNSDLQYEQIDKEPTICRLKTIKELRTEVRDSVHNELTMTVANHTFVGVVDDHKRTAVIQGGVKLFLVDYGMYAKEFFYQLGLTDFGNFGMIRLEPPLQLQQVLELGVEHMKMKEGTPEGFDWSEVASTVAQHLHSHRAMLSEYFSLDISNDGELASIPLMLKGYLPPMAKLPSFLLRLGPHVVWTDEKACFKTFLQELAGFHVPEVLVAEESSSAEDAANISARKVELHQAIENVLFPAFKSRLVATEGLLQGTIEIANLKGLYRVFERC